MPGEGGRNGSIQHQTAEKGKIELQEHTHITNSSSLLQIIGEAVLACFSHRWPLTHPY
jgi:hypothetical protein